MYDQPFFMSLSDQQQQFAWQNALIAVAVKPRTMIAAKTYPMHISLFSQTLLLIPMLWNALQKPWQR